MTSKNKKNNFSINKDQLGLVLGLIAIVIIVGFLFFINKATVGEDSIAGNAVLDIEPEELTVSCSAESLVGVKHVATEKGCSIISR